MVVFAGDTACSELSIMAIVHDWIILLRGNVTEQTEIGDRHTFQTERYIPRVAEQRHLEQLEPMHERNGVLPMSETLPIPQFPKQAADQRCHRRHPDTPPITLCEC